MAEKRIIEYTEASTVTNNDYIYMDSQVNGQQKITPNRLVSTSQAYYSQGNSIIQLGEHVDDVESAMQSIVSDMGDLTGLDTDDKSSVVNAVNELKADIGDLDDLETTDKSSLVNAINEARGSGGDGLTADIKTALLQIASKVAYIDDDGQTYYDALEDALYPPAELVSISAVYTQSGTVYDTDTLDSLKDDLVVTALYDDSSTETVTTYTLSGTLTEGTSTITVAYGGKTTSFNVTVSTSRLPSGYTEYDYVGQNPTGSTWISGVPTTATLSSDYTIQLKFYCPTGTYTSPQAILGTRVGSGGTKEFGLFITQSTGKLGYWYSNTDSTQAMYITMDAVNTITIKPVGDSQSYPNNAVIDINGTEYSTGSTSTGTTWSNWFGMMGYASSASTVGNLYNLNYQLGEIIVSDGNNVVYDFIPCSDGTNIGWYESVNEAFWQVSTSNFIVGYWE